MTDNSLITILAVDDDEAKRYTLARILRSAGYAVLEAATGEAAMELTHEKLDLIVLDVNMPGISGHEVCRRLKANPSTSSIPILQVSSSATAPQDRVAGLESGADAYYPDLIEPSELIATVRALLRLRKAEDIARTVSSEWQTTFDSITDAICLFDARGLVRRCNRALERLTERPAAAVLGRPLSDSLPTALAALGEVVRPGNLSCTAEQVQDVAAGHRWFRMTINPIRGAGSAGGAVCILSDITSRKFAEQNAEFLHAASESLAALVDYESTLQKVARLAVPYFADGSAVHLVGENGALQCLATAHAVPEWEQLLTRLTDEPDTLAGTVLPVADVVKTGKATLHELVSPAGSGTVAGEFQTRSLLCVPLVLRNRILGSLTFLITESPRSFNRADLAVAEDLSRRVGIALDNARLYRELKSADQRKDEFLAMLAHELRNPLAPIRNAVALLGETGIDAESLREIRAVMERQIEHLVRLVDDLLDVSRILRGKIELRRDALEIRTVVDRALETAGPLISAQAHELTVTLPDEPVWLNGDLIRLAQVLANLLNNAAKYTPRGGRIELSVATSPQGVLIRVTDNGIGIDGGQLHSIFDLFMQADQAIERSQGGLGIGLTLVRNLVEMHGGTVTVNSPGIGQGSEFVIALPTIAPAAQSSQAGWTPTPIRSLRILVVEDNVGAAQILAKLLRRFWNHDVRVVHDGLAAIREARLFHPELVLIDIGLPGLNGFEVAERLRQIPEFGNTLLVALTGYGQLEDRRRSEEAGFDEHLVKPAAVDTLEVLFSHPKVQLAAH